MHIGIVTVAYNRPELLERMVRSAHESLAGSGHTPIFFVAVHSGAGDERNPMNHTVGGLGQKYGFPHHFHILHKGLSGQREGIAASWNTGIEVLYGLRPYTRGHGNCDAVLVVNDDIEFGPGDVEKIAAETAIHRPRPAIISPHGKHHETWIDGSGKTLAVFGSDVHIVVVRGTHDRHGEGVPLGYSCFGITPAGVAKLGAFDQNYFPAYGEDCDYAYRARLAGMREVGLELPTVRHVGSAALNGPVGTGEEDHRLMLQNGTTQYHNGLYHIRKWGGPNGEERFKVAFELAGNPDSEDPPPHWNLPGYFIPWENREAPYGPPYDRTWEERCALVQV